MVLRSSGCLVWPISRCFVSSSERLQFLVRLDVRVYTVAAVGACCVCAWPFPLIPELGCFRSIFSVSFFDLLVCRRHAWRVCGASTRSRLVRWSAPERRRRREEKVLLKRTPSLWANPGRKVVPLGCSAETSRLSGALPHPLRCKGGGHPPPRQNFTGDQQSPGKMHPLLASPVGVNARGEREKGPEVFRSLPKCCDPSKPVPNP